MIRSRPLQVKVVADRSGAFADELAGQGQIEALIVENFAAGLGDPWIAEIQSQLFETGDIFQVGNIKLNFSVED